MISAVILTKNEEQNIERCLKSVKWCDEIIIIDDKSSDKTLEIARKYKAKIYINSLGNDFSSQRNFGLTKVGDEWVIFVDSDEVVSDALAFEISNAIHSQGLGNYSGFYIKRTDLMWGKQLKHGEQRGIKLLRLAKKGAGLWEGMVHEKWKIDGLVGNLRNPILHFPHKTLEDFLKEINLYTDIRVKELESQSVKVFFWSIVFYPLGKFVFNYIFKGGFLDGLPGLVFAITMSFHSFLVRGKLWLKRKVK